MSFRAALLALALASGAVACEGRSPSSMTSAPTTSSWVQANGLEVQLEMPAKPVSGVSGGRPSPVAVTLRFRNASQQPLRFYLIEGEPFRSFQSLLLVYEQGSGKLVTAQPDPRPHGYVVTEKDFHLLAPGEEKTFTQSLYVARVARGGPSVEPLEGFEKGGAFRVRWKYENSVTQWKGGAMTLDGPTQSLFGGGPIPHIWTGKVEAEAALHVAAP
ncbi:MAG TPA: hypothetical protein VE093_12260 [Polyangiaceae bacterium]|nr:hypothetical protein [Polyangiaceae bacterium]